MSVSGDGSEAPIIGLCGHDGLYSKCYMYGSERRKCERENKAHPTTGHKDPEGEQRYSSILSLTSALDGVGGERHAPAALPPGKTPYPLYRRLGRPHGRSGRVRKISLPAGFDPRTVQRVASRYTD